jgi:hypothetical protein
MPSFLQVVEALQPSYRTIDLRIVMRRQIVFPKVAGRVMRTEEGGEDIWVADQVAVRLGARPVEQIKLSHSDLIASYPLQAERFKIVLIAKPISEWQALSEAFQSGGKIGIGEDEVTLPTVDLGQAARPYCSDLRLSEEDNWFTFSIIAGNFYENVLESADIQAATAKARLPRIQDVVRSMLGLPASSSQFGICIAAPAYAKVQQIEVTEGRLHFELLHHQAIAIEPRVFTVDGPAHPVPKSPVDLQSGNRDAQGDFHVEHYQSRQKQLTNADWLQFHLFCDVEITVWRVQTSNGEVPFPAQVSAFVRREERHPLLAIFERFCAFDQFRSYLLDPGENNAKKVSKATAFELHVSALFSLMNFSAIVLGDHETLRATQTQFEHASIDILTHHPKSKKVFIVSCTMNPPKPADYSNILNAKAVIEREIQPHTQIHAIIVTAASHCVPERSTSPDERVFGQGSDTTVLDREALERILNALQTGDVDLALRLIDDSFWRN